MTDTTKAVQAVAGEEVREIVAAMRVPGECLIPFAHRKVLADLIESLLRRCEEAEAEVLTQRGIAATQRMTIDIQQLRIDEMRKDAERLDRLAKHFVEVRALTVNYQRDGAPLVFSYGPDMDEAGAIEPFDIRAAIDSALGGGGEG